jgi:hypothetical protein
MGAIVGTGAGATAVADGAPTRTPAPDGSSSTESVATGASRRTIGRIEVIRDGWGTSRRATIAAWLLFAVVASYVAGLVARNDFRDHPVLGDASAYLLQAESLGFAGHDLVYDQRDLDYFRSFEWADDPYGLYFQRHGDGWAFAKPYGYSAVLAPAIRLFGVRAGVAVANLALLATLGALGAATLRLRYRGAIVPIVLGVFLFASPLVFYAFHLWVEVFWSPLVLASLYAMVRAARDRSLPWAVLGAALAAFLLSEKLPAVALVAPVYVVMLARTSTWRARALVVAATAAVFVVAVAPYLHHSDGAAANPYGGERYYARGGVPFGGSDDYRRVASDETFRLDYVRDELLASPGDTAASAAYYLVGRHTGLLPFTPLALVVLVASIARLRRADWLGVAVVAGVVGYIGFYVLLFPANYNGGGQTLGNRYFVQVYPVVLVLIAVMGFRPKRLLAGAVVSAVLAAIFMAPHHRDAPHAIERMDETSWAQGLLPFEANQDGANYFRCGENRCPPADRGDDDDPDEDTDEEPGADGMGDGTGDGG